MPHQYFVTDEDKSILPFVIIKWFNRYLYPQMITHDRMKFSKENVSYFAHSFPFSSTLYLCPKEITDYCLYVKEFQLTDIKKCEFEAVPVTVPVLKDSNNKLEYYTTCGPGHIGKLYTVQYEVSYGYSDYFALLLVFTIWFTYIVLLNFLLCSYASPNKTT